MIVFLNCDTLRLFEVLTEEFSVASGTIGSVSVNVVFLLNSEALTDPEDTSLKLDLKELKEMGPDPKSSVLLTEREHIMGRVTVSLILFQQR